jgi:predicted enzyme involved in methoxymalonyl-ACP biosynthesis
MKASKSASNRWNNANAMRTQCDSNAIKESKGKENKVKDIIINNKQTFEKSDLVCLPENIVYNISVKFKSLKQVTIDQKKIYELWDVFLNENLEIKEYNKIAEIYTHFSNWILKQKFETIQEYLVSLQIEVEVRLDDLSNKNRIKSLVQEVWYTNAL